MNKLDMEKAKTIEKLNKKIDQVCPYIYSTMCLTMFEHGISADEIGDILEESMNVWVQINEEGRNPINEVREKLNIEIYEPQ